MYIAEGIRNPTKDQNLESNFHRPRPESSTSNLESTAQNPESKTALDTWGEIWIIIAKCALCFALVSRFLQECRVCHKAPVMQTNCTLKDSGRFRDDDREESVG